MLLLEGDLKRRVADFEPDALAEAIRKAVTLETQDVADKAHQAHSTLIGNVGAPSPLEDLTKIPRPWCTHRSKQTKH